MSSYDPGGPLLKPTGGMLAAVFWTLLIVFLVLFAAVSCRPTSTIVEACVVQDTIRTAPDTLIVIARTEVCE